MKCINTSWDTNRNRRRGHYSCPQCRQTFSPRPVLKRNTLLAELLEEHTRRISQNAAASAAAAAAADDTYAAPGDEECDVCTGRKRKASMFCLVCLASYCETHLKPHFEEPPLKKHNLIQDSSQVKESICGHHDKLLEIYCRTDQQFICPLCVMDEHRGHDTVAVAAEKCAEMKKQLEQTKQEIADRVLNSKRRIVEVTKAAACISDAAWEVCDDFERTCREHICYVRTKCSEMREKVAEAEKAGVDWTNHHLGQLEREVFALRRREEKINQLSLTEDPIQFLQGFQALGDLPVFTDSHDELDMLSEFVTAQTDNLKNTCDKEKKELFDNCEDNLLSKMLGLYQQIPSRRYLLKKYSTVEVDPNTVAACLCLSDRNREISLSDGDQALPDHPDRFTFYNQALCKKGLTGIHYWEVEWDGGIVDLAVSYKSIRRKGPGKECCFGHNPLSWKLTCTSSGCTFWHHNLHKGRIAPVLSCRVGIHLDYKAGTLAFYSVSDTLTQLHQIKTTFTEPLYPGFSVDLGSTLKICNI